MTLLLTADIHLTTRPQDEYRWGLFDFLHKQVKKTGATAVLFLGDITDQKDRHPSELVNRLVAAMDDLSHETHVFILRGNHDYHDIDSPFFAFLGRNPRVEFICEPTFWDLDDGVHGDRTNKECLFLPNTRDYAKDWADLPSKWKKTKYIFTHCTFDGALAENGTRLTNGVPVSFFADFPGQVWSGDIHVPQGIGKNINYVGAPYRIRFGDDFTPRVVLLRKGVAADLHFQTVTKHVVTVRKLDSLQRYDFAKGDQVKVRVELRRRDFPVWKDMKQDIDRWASEVGVVLFGPELVALPDPHVDKDRTEEVTGHRTVVQVLADHVRQKKLDQVLAAVGMKLLEAI